MSPRQSTRVTIAITFLMGYLDAFTFISFNEVFVSAQTGNVIMIGIRLLSQNWHAAIPNLLTLLGFIVGVAIGQLVTVQPKLATDNINHRFIYLNTIILLVIASLTNLITPWIIYLCLSLLSGYQLNNFRQVNGINVNNGIMTGNLKVMVNHFATFAITRQPAEQRAGFTLLFVIMIFISGVSIATLMTINFQLKAIWLAVFINLLLCWQLLFRTHHNKKSVGS